MTTSLLIKSARADDTPRLRGPVKLICTPDIQTLPPPPHRLQSLGSKTLVLPGSRDMMLGFPECHGQRFILLSCILPSTPNEFGPAFGLHTDYFYQTELPSSQPYWIGPVPYRLMWRRLEGGGVALKRVEAKVGQLVMKQIVTRFPDVNVEWMLRALLPKRLPAAYHYITTRPIPVLQVWAAL